MRSALRGIFCSVLAGLGSLPLAFFWLSDPTTVSTYIALLSVMSPLWYATNLRTGFYAAALALVLQAPLWALDPAPLACCLSALIALSIGRSGIAHPAGLTRGIAREWCLAVVAGGAALLLYDGTVIGTALAFWCFGLIQSSYPLLPGGQAKKCSNEQGDRFTQAHSAANRLLGAM